MALREVLSRVDHLVYASSNLERGIAEIEQLLGIRASLGGQHPNWGTRNALIALGPSSYLEIIAPDPDHSPPVEGRPFGLEAIGSSRLVGWAAKDSALTNFRDAAAQHGVELGRVLSGSRKQADGTVLMWKLTDLRCVIANGIVPFFIDWGTTPHPALVAPRGATLVSLVAKHPNADRVRQMLRIVGVDLPVDAGHALALIAQIDCPNGRIVML
jgi:hypothetical protein